MHRDEVLRLADEVFIEPRPMTPAETYGLMEFIRDDMTGRKDVVADLKEQVRELDDANADLAKSIVLKIGDRLVDLERVNRQGSEGWEVSLRGVAESGDSVDLKFHGWDVKLEILAEDAK